MKKSATVGLLTIAFLLVALAAAPATGNSSVMAQVKDENQAPPLYYIVQFGGPVQQAWKDQVTTQGAELLAYLPSFAFKVRMNPGTARKVEDLESVTGVSLFPAALKLSPNLVRDGTRLYTVRVERGADAGQATAVIVRTGAKVLDRQRNILLVAADATQLEAIAEILHVAWVQNFMLREKHNEYGAGVIMGANTANGNGYDGSTQTVAVADTGLGSGTAGGAHPDIPAGRITAIYNWLGASSASCYNVIGDGPQDVDSGHGTHVATSVLGDGGLSGEGKGTAPAAHLAFQAVEDYVDFVGFCSLFYADGYYLIGIPSDLHDLFQQAYNTGARIHSNSWGSDAMGDYTVDSANTDDFIWNNPYLTITFSAGNAGPGTNTIGSPATAKNVITVGASGNDRQGNYQCDTGLAYTNCAAQGGQNNVGTDAGNAEQMASFSSRGPADDGRIKPDVVAPGTWVLSGYSTLYQQGYDGSPNPQNTAWQYDGWGYPRNGTYKYMGGTSMSNPLTAGAAAVVRDFYQKAHGHNASAALVKASLINSAVDILDENNDGVDDNDFPIPNNHEGWGRVNLANATDGIHQFIDETTGLATGGSTAYIYNVSTGGSPFKVSLVWSDYPSTETASQNLVNDLDLVVTAPGGATYRGNVFGGGWSQNGGVVDRTNNVENVYIQSAAAGTWTVEVSSFNVPVGPQPFALVVDGAFGPPAPPTVSLVEPASSTTDGGTWVNITGTDFVPGAEVSFGGTAATGVSVKNDTRITAFTPAHAAGVVDLVVTNPDNQSDTLASGLTYVVPPPPELPPGSEIITLEDFEPNATGWQADGLWHLANNTSCLTPGYQSPTHSFYYGQEPACTYDTGVANQGTLTSPVISLDGYGSSSLEFYYWRAVESFAVTFDRTYVKVSYDGGQTWYQVWYRDSTFPSEANWKQELLLLYPGIATSMQVRFGFETGDGVANNFVGWLVDDVTVRGVPSGSPDTIGPVTSGVAASPNPTEGASPVALTATVSDSTTGDSTITAAEYFVDTVGTDGTGTAMGAEDGLFDSSTEVVSASVDATGLSLGTHTIHIHGKDAAGNWGATNSVQLTVSEPYSGDAYQGVQFHPFTTDPSNVMCVDSTKLAGNKDCDPVNLFFSGKTWSEVELELTNAGWSSGSGSSQQVYFYEAVTEAFVGQWQDTQLAQADGASRYHIRLYQAPGADPPLTLGAVHHEDLLHTIDMDWEVAEGFVASELCDPTCTITELLEQQKQIQGNDGEWRSWLNDASATVIIDTTPPTDPTVSSTSHIVSTWSVDSMVDVEWSGAADAGSGVAGYSFAWDTSPSTLPDTISDLRHTTDPHRTKSTVLANGNSHYFHLRTVDQAGNWTSTVHLGPFFIDTTAPSVGTVNDGVGADIDFQTSTTTFSANWAGFSDAGSGIAGYTWAIGTTPGGTDIQSYTSVGSATTSASSLTLSDGATYYVSVIATDAVGNLSAAATSDGVTADATAPTVPSDLAAVAVSSSQINLTWTGSSDAVGVAGYEIHRDGVLLDTTTGTSYSDTGLSASTIYTYEARAFDAAGNLSAFIQDIATTDAAGGSANDMYVWDIVFESKLRGKGGAKHDERIIVIIRRDSDADGVAEATDAAVNGASVTVELRDSGGVLVGSRSGITNGDGTFRTDFFKNLAADTYVAEVTVLNHATFTWNKNLDPTANDSDLDADNLPDQQHSIPH